MAFRIRDNIKRIQEKIKLEQEASDDGKTSQTANDLQEKAVAAILGGAAEWEPYMVIFATDEKGFLHEDALARLRPECHTGESVSRNKARAYLIGNGNCGPMSVDGPDMEFGVGDTLDFTVSDESADDVDMALGVGDSVDFTVPVQDE
ncbi:MAG TPA: hypothetical protein VNB22_21590 [Pyrinomonadaceae bacterium]|jgi:hypothetical protein|nr:hypothetical protein [Pyrinomonadaceae bacterium]